MRHVASLYDILKYPVLLLGMTGGNFFHISVLTAYEANINIWEYMGKLALELPGNDKILNVGTSFTDS